MWHIQAIRRTNAVAEPGITRGGLSLQAVRRLLAERLSPELRKEAVQDPLTGALNLRGDRAATARALADRRPGTRLLRLRADLDNFKALNDCLGHAAGDRALCVVRAALECATRDVDVVSLARPGGDEFALTLRVATGVAPEGIRDRIEEAVNHALSNAGFDSADGRRVGISIGVALGADPTTPEALDTAADAAARERKLLRRVSVSRGLLWPGRGATAAAPAT